MKFTLEKIFLIIGSISAVLAQAFFGLIFLAFQVLPLEELADSDNISMFTETPYASLYGLLTLIGVACLIAVFVLAFFVNKNPRIVASLSILLTTAAAVVNVPSYTIIPIFIAYALICAAVILIFRRLHQSVAIIAPVPEINNGIDPSFPQYTA